MHGRGACMAGGGMHGRGACVAGGIHGRGRHAWQGACMARGVHGRGRRGGMSPGRCYEIRSMMTVTAPDRCYYLNQAYLPMFIAGLKRGKTNRSQTATDVVMVIK